jgi:hypothetical protein
MLRFFIGLCLALDPDPAFCNRFFVAEMIL